MGLIQELKKEEIERYKKLIESIDKRTEKLKETRRRHQAKLDKLEGKQ